MGKNGNGRVVYLLHFDAPLGDLGNRRGQAQHYMGCTDDLERRLREHASGNKRVGAALTAAAVARDITWTVARIWEGGFDLERRLKSWHKHRLLCPVCRNGDGAKE